MLRALASSIVLALCGCATVEVAGPASDYDILVEACLDGAPTFSSAERVVLGAGGATAENPGWANSTQLDASRVVAAWEFVATGIPDKIAPIGLLEGRYRGRPARSCMGVQSVYERPALEERLSSRYNLQLVRHEPIYPLGFVRTTYSASLNGVDALVVTEGAGGSGFPMVEVILVEPN